MENIVAWAFWHVSGRQGPWADTGTGSLSACPQDRVCHRARTRGLLRCGNCERLQGGQVSGTLLLCGK